MKRIFFITSCALLFSACGGSSTETVVEDADSIRTNLIPFLDGVWVMNDYLKEIESNHSPRASWDTLNGPVALIINKYSMRNDSLVAGVNLNNHEGSAFTIFFKYGDKKTQLRTDIGKVTGARNRVDIGYQLTESGKVFVCLYEYNDKNELVKQKFFKKVMDKQMDSDLSAGIDHAVNLQLFKGKFAYTNEAGKPDTAEFREDGKTKGFLENKYYHIRTDFNDAYSNVDVVSFFVDENTEKGYGFQLVSGNIDLYQLDSVHEKGELKYGKKLYTLIRQPD